jgi:hypothetical protein
MKTPLIIASILYISGNVLIANAQSINGPYDYLNNIDTAVKEANNNPRNETYVGHRRNIRTTSKRIDFPRLMNTEMSSEIIDGVLDTTAAGIGDVAPARTSPLKLNVEEVIANKQDDFELNLLADSKTNAIDLSIQPPATINDFSPAVYKVDKVEYRSENFFGSAKDIRSAARSRAYITLGP